MSKKGVHIIMKLVFRNNFLFRCWLVLLVGMACCTQPLAQDIQLEENFDVLGAAFGEFGLDDASSKFFPGQDAPALMSGVRPASCGVPFEDPIVDGCAGAMSRLVEVSPGDWAFWTENWSFGVQPENRFNNGIRSDLAVARADSPECVFRVFGDSCVPFPGEAYPRANGPHGPFHQIAGFAGWGEEIQGQANAMERDIELGMTFWSGLGKITTRKAAVEVLMMRQAPSWPAMTTASVWGARRDRIVEWLPKRRISFRPDNVPAWVVIRTGPSRKPPAATGTGRRLDP